MVYNKITQKQFIGIQNLPKKDGHQHKMIWAIFTTME